MERLAAGALVLGLALAAVGLLLQPWAGWAAVFTGDGEADLLWMRVGALFGAGPDLVRVAVFAPVHGLLLLALAGPLGRAREAVAHGLARLGRGLWAAGLLGTALVGLLLAPLVVQPTLLAWGDGPAARLANLLDGRSAVATADAAARRWRQLSGAPQPGRYTVSTAEGGLNAPVMTRWDALLRAHTRDRIHYAQTRAFLYVESGGRQYAVSRTGCAGLMQFCVSTARRRPFHGIFGAGAVSACGCGGRPCAIPSPVQRALETDALAIERHRAAFPCDPADARFDPERAIRAGAAYTTELAESVGGHLELMYIGYNSGPAVARRMWRAIDRNPRASLDDLRPHLAPVLRRWYGEAAPGRAQGLLDVHLPKLRRAYEASLRDIR